MADTEKGSRPYISRGIAYAITSVLVLFSGYLMNSAFRQPSTFLLSIPIGLFTIFFVTYAVCYDYDYSKQEVEQNAYDYDVVSHREAIIYTCIFALAFVAIAILVYIILYLKFGGPVPDYPFFIYVLICLSLYLGYSRYLYKKRRLAGYPEIRHWLVWPVILSIAITLYYGRFFSTIVSSRDIISSIELHFPVIILLVIFLIAEIIEVGKKQFLITSVVSFTTLVALTIIQGLTGMYLPPILGIYFPAMLFCIIMAGYLAVFESWWMTAYIASQESAPKGFRSVALPETPSETTIIRMELTQRYYGATLLAHTIAVWLIPFAYIYSDYNVLFIALFTLHAITSFAVWLLRGKDAKSLAKKKWRGTKIIFGVAFLITMVIGVKAKAELPLDKNIIVPMFTKLIAAMGVAALAWITLIVKDYRQLDQNEDQNKPEQLSFLSKVIILFTKKINVVRQVGISTVGACFIILLFQDLPATAPYLNKSHQAFLCYFIIFLSCCFVELLNITNWYRFPVNFLFSLLGVLYTLRIPPSFLIGFAVLLPGLSAGLTFKETLIRALPFSLIAMGGFALNDYFDFKKDSVNKPYRAIPSENLRRSHVMFLAVSLLTLSCYLSLLIARTRLEVFLYLVSIVGVVGYNLVVRYLGCAKAFYTAAFSSLPILYDVLIFEYSSIYFLVPISTILFVSARELLMDIRDVPGDNQSGVKTMPIIIGAIPTAQLAFSLKIISLFMLLPFVFSHSVGRGILLWLAMAISTLVMYKAWWIHSGKYQRPIIRWLWLTMFLGITLIST